MAEKPFLPVEYATFQDKLQGDVAALYRQQAITDEERLQAISKLLADYDAKMTRIGEAISYFQSECAKRGHPRRVEGQQSSWSCPDCGASS